MARTKRICPAGEVFHVLNRAVARLTIFEKPEDYAAFMRVVEETWEIVPLPIYAMVAMPNHWHFVVRPESSDQVSEFFRRLITPGVMLDRSVTTVSSLPKKAAPGWPSRSSSGL